MSTVRKPISALRIDWLSAREQPLLQTPGKIGLSACPGRPDLGGTVGGDVQRLALLGVKLVTTLVEDQEMAFYGVFGLQQAVRSAGLRGVQFPIPDAEPPDDLWATQKLCQELLRWLGEGHDILVHCIGGWGRSGTIASLILVHEGFAPDQAIAHVRQARSPRCVETVAQARFVEEYAQQLRHLRRFYAVLSEKSDRLAGVPGNRVLRRRNLEKIALFDASGVSAAVKRFSQPEGWLVVSGEATPEQIAGTDDLRLDRCWVPYENKLAPTPFSSASDCAD